jgi:hypothetical protein
MYLTLLRCQRACSVPRRSYLGVMHAFTRCQQTCSVSRWVYKHFSQLFEGLFSFKDFLIERGDAENPGFWTHRSKLQILKNFLSCPSLRSINSLLIKLTFKGRETSLSCSLKEQGQRKKNFYG